MGALNRTSVSFGLILLSIIWLEGVQGQAFTEVSATAGLVYSQASPPVRGKQVMTGGAAAGDFDNDGWVDLFLTRLGQTDLLYRNRGDGTFQDVSESAFPNRIIGDTNGAVWGDIDNDNDLDLFVTSIDSYRYHLFVNDGNGVFTEEGYVRGAAVPTSVEHYGFSPTFGDFDRDGYIDLYVTEWGQVVELDEKARAFELGVKSHARLLRNRGAAQPGYFDDVTIAAGVSLDGTVGRRSAGCNRCEAVFAFAGRFADFDLDGHPDLAVTGDFGTSRLFWNNGDGTFTDGTYDSDVGTDENGMGSAIGDFDGDGDLDWFVTAIYDDSNPNPFWGITGNRLYRYEENRKFSDATDVAGVREGFWGWGASWFDYDNDSDLDLIMTNGYPAAGFVADPMRLWRNDGEGRFEEVSVEEGVTSSGQGKGLVVFDYDNDGDQDVLVVNNGGPPALYRNDYGSEAGSWLKVKTVGTTSNRDGIGARISVTVHEEARKWMVHERSAGSNYLGQNEGIAHFGLGQRKTAIAEVSVQWPSGKTQRILGVVPNTIVVAVEPD